MNTKQIKETEAIVRNEAWAKLTPEQQLEYIYHLVNAGDTDTISKMLGDHGHDLVEAGHVELLPLIAELNASQIDVESWCNILELRGDIYSLQGRWDEAEKEYDEALPLVKKSKSKAMEGRILSSKKRWPHQLVFRK